MTPPAAALPRLWLIADAGLGETRAVDALGSFAPRLEHARGAVGVIERDHLGTPDATRLERLRRLQAILAATGAPLFVNTRVDLAIAVGADGVQLTQRSLPPAAIRGRFPSLRLAMSVHDANELSRATADAVDFVLLAPIHAPLSKPLSRPPLGEAGLASLAAATTVPIVALGGMTPGTVPSALAAGAAGVATLGGVFGAPDPSRALDAFLEALG